MKASTNTQPRAYECSVDGLDWATAVVTALTRSKARYQRYLDLNEAWEIPITAIRVRSLGPVGIVQPMRLHRTAIQRGLEFVHAGMAIEVEGHRGVIADCNDSANWDVLFTEGPHKGQTLNCHPTWKTRYFDEHGNLIREFL